jgi:prepilin-type N-terminal cleavage/methylation domain-containing protein
MENFFRQQKGFTLIELIISITIAAIVVLPLSIFIMEVIARTIMPEYYQVAASLLEGELERVTNLRFTDITNEGPTNFTGNFNNYSYQVSFYYVNPGDLNTSVSPTVTDYKRVTITVSRTSFPNVSAVTVRANN